MKIKRVGSKWIIEEGGTEWTVTREGSVWAFHPAMMFTDKSPEDEEAKILARLCRELLACRKESRVLRDDLLAAYSALADLVHLKDISSKSEHYEVVKLAHHPF